MGSAKVVVLSSFLVDVTYQKKIRFFDQDMLPNSSATAEEQDDGKKMLALPKASRAPEGN